MRRLGIDPGTIEAIVLSHGHWDHVTGMEGLVRVLGRTRLPVMIHPEFWRRRRIRFPGLDPAELPSTSRAALEGIGFAIVEDRRPSFLLDGAVLITGEVDRTTEFETGFRGHEALRDGELGARPADPRRPGARRARARPRPGGAQRLRPRRDRQHRPLRPAADGRGRVAAIIGGFHLSGPMFEPIIGPTVEALAELAPGAAHARALHGLEGRSTGWRRASRTRS